MERVKNASLVFCLFIVLLVIFSSYFRANAVGTFWGALAGTPLLVHIFNRVAPRRRDPESDRTVPALVANWRTAAAADRASSGASDGGAEWTGMKGDGKGGVVSVTDGEEESRRGAARKQLC